MRWLPRSFRKVTQDLFRTRPNPASRKRRPRLETLEDRTVPATHTWTGGSGVDLKWSTGTNWTGGAPANGEGGLIVLNFPVVAAGLKSTIDDIPGLNVDQINITDGSYSFGASAATTLNLTGAATPAFSETVGSSTFNTPLTINFNAPCVFNTVGFDQINSVVTGPGGLTNSGTGGLSLNNGGNSYDGQTTVNAGFINIAVDHALGSTVGGTVV